MIPPAIKATKIMILLFFAKKSELIIPILAKIINTRGKLRQYET